MDWWIWLLAALIVLAVGYFGYQWFFAVPKTDFEQDQQDQQEYQGQGDDGSGDINDENTS